MNRDESFTLRVNFNERQLIAAVAERLDRNESDTVRLLIREKARELGLTLELPKGNRHAAPVAV